MKHIKFKKKKFDFISLMGYKTKVAFITIGGIVSIGFLIFANQMANELKKKEYIQTRLWSRAMTIAANPNDINTPQNIRELVSEIMMNDNDMSFIMTKEDLSILTYKNIDDEIIFNPKLFRKELEDITNDNEPIQIEHSNGNVRYIFYRDSKHIILLKYIPYIQVFSLAMILSLIIVSYSTSKHNEQNKIWVGMAKETAHQLGTPSSSLLGWLEYLKSLDIDQDAVKEMGKDISRLLKVVDRFSKIGSAPTLEKMDIIDVVMRTITYFQVRKPKKVNITMVNNINVPIIVNLNDSLFEWVMENMIKNAIDALKGEGNIKVVIYPKGDNINIDISDDGKGISKSNFNKVFQPGFSTKTRGWGLGLSLSKRIIEENHEGKLYVAESQVGMGTVMRIELKKLEKN